MPVCGAREADRWTVALFWVDLAELLVNRGEQLPVPGDSCGHCEPEVVPAMPVPEVADPTAHGVPGGTLSEHDLVGGDVVQLAHLDEVVVMPSLVEPQWPPPRVAVRRR